MTLASPQFSQIKYPKFKCLNQIKTILKMKTPQQPEIDIVYIFVLDYDYDWHNSSLLNSSTGNQKISLI